MTEDTDIEHPFDDWFADDRNIEKQTEWVLERYRRTFMDVYSQRRKWSAGVYFVMSGDEFVKIGYSSKPRVRIEEIIRLNPVAIVLGYIPGTLEFERFLHSTFYRSAHRNEWFETTPEINEVVPQIMYSGAVFARDQFGWDWADCFPEIKL